MTMLRNSGITAKYISSDDWQVEDDEIKLPGLDQMREPHIQVGDGYMAFSYWTDSKKESMLMGEYTNNPVTIFKQVTEFKKNMLYQPN